MLRRCFQRGRGYFSAECHESDQYVVCSDRAGCVCCTRNGASGLLGVHGGGALFPWNGLSHSAVQGKVDEKGACLNRYSQVAKRIAGVCFK